jgi:hypothetical protein
MGKSPVNSRPFSRHRRFDGWPGNCGGICFAQKLEAIHDRLRQQRTATRPFSGLTGI